MSARAHRARLRRPVFASLRGMRALVTLVLLAACAASAAGCGPSLRMLHESTVYFERCHAAEMRDEVSLETKAACWERWLRWYSASQANTRILYARERLVYLAQGELVDPLPEGESAAAEVAPEVEVGATTSSTSRSTNTGLLPRNPRRTGDPVCEPVCRPHWDGCIIRCDANDRPCIFACQSNYGSCMSGCI